MGRSPMTKAVIDATRRIAQGDAPPRPPPSLASVSFDLWDRWSAHPGHGLTVARLVQILRMAERGWTPPLADLFNDVLGRDAHLRAQYDMVVGGVAGQPWLVRPGGDAPEDLEAADALGQHLRRVPNVRAMFAHLLTARPWGWAATEILWETVDGQLAPIWFENVHHRRIVFDDRGAPRLRTAMGPDGGEPLIPSRWLFRAHSHTSLSPALGGLLCTAMWPALLKANAIRDMALFLERYGLPTPTGTYGEGTPKEEKEVLIDVVSKLGTNNYGVFHESCKIASIAPEGNSVTDTHSPAVDLFNAEISKVMTLGTLTSGEGTSTGSYALGTVHENGLMRTLNGEGRIVGDLLEQQLGLPFVRWNPFGKARAPRVEFQITQHLTPLERLEIFERSKNSMDCPVDADQYRTEMQLKPPTGEAFGGAGGPRKPGAMTAAEVARKVMARAA
jgi:phage gp29-like protein